MDNNKLPCLGKNAAIGICKVLNLDPDMVRRIVIDANTEDVLMAKIDLYITDVQSGDIVKTIGNAKGAIEEVK